MAIEANIDAARRLAEALERSRAPQGEGLASETRSPVPRELAQAFRELMEGPAPAALRPAPGALGAGPLEGPQGPRSAQPGGFAAGTSDLAADARAGSGAEAAAQPLPSPAELLGLQFSVGMQLFEAKAGVAVRDGLSEQLEEVLRSSS